MKKWVYKVNARRPGKLTGWHFDRYFSYRGKKPYEMGGDGWIRSAQSWERLWRVRRGDLFICYQTEERKIYGLARAATDGYESHPGSGRCNCVDFAPGGLRLAEPVNISRPEHRAVFAHVRAFSVPSRGTIHALAEDEFAYVLRALRRVNPRQKKALVGFLRTCARLVGARGGGDLPTWESCTGRRRAAGIRDCNLFSPGAP